MLLVIKTYDRQVENHIDIDPIRVVYRGFSIEEFMVYKVPRLLFFENYFVHFHSSRNSVTWSDIYEISESEYDIVVNTDKPLEIGPYGMFGTRVVEAR